MALYEKICILDGSIVTWDELGLGCESHKSSHGFTFPMRQKNYDAFVKASASPTGETISDNAYFIFKVTK